MAQTKAEKLGVPKETKLHNVTCDKCSAVNQLTADPAEVGADIYTTRNVVDEETNTGSQVTDHFRETLWECVECGARNLISVKVKDEEEKDKEDKEETQ